MRETTIPNVADLREAMPRTAHDVLPGERVYGCGPDNVPGGRDTVGHSSVQGWSAGDIFPAVIAVVESYSAFAADRDFPLAARLRYRAFDLTLWGRTERFSSYDDADAAARWALNNRAAWLDGE